jgi:Ser/Thr protein kinase RdoA (MazF antagonist)
MRTALEALPATDRNYGLIHWDFCADNIRWGTGRLGVIDPLLAAFVSGYRSVRRLGSADLARLPLFMLMSNLLFYASLRIIVEEGREDSEPEWVKGLRKKLQGMVDKNRGELVTFAG